MRDTHIQISELSCRYTVKLVIPVQSQLLVTRTTVQCETTQTEARASSCVFWQKRMPLHVTKRPEHFGCGTSHAFYFNKKQQHMSWLNTSIIHMVTLLS